MILQVYKDKQHNKILIQNKSCAFDKEKYCDYEFMEEFSSETWEDCNRQIASKYFNNISQD